MKRQVILVAVSLLASCSRGTEEDARQAVRTYVERLAVAYRTSDSTVLDPLVGDEHGRKLLGLIGVKRDTGVVLDAKLLDLQFTRVEREGKTWIVDTRERWYYRDRKIGSGEQVGDDSTDSYALRYTFTPADGKLVLTNLAFVEDPVVGRKVAPVPTDARVLHGGEPDGAGPSRAPPPGHPPVPRGNPQAAPR